MYEAAPLGNKDDKREFSGERSTGRWCRGPAPSVLLLKIQEVRGLGVLQNHAGHYSSKFSRFRTSAVRYKTRSHGQ